jgi:methyl-accepting chemotaxis protein
MKNYSRLASIGVLICSIFLGGDVLLYLNNVKYLLADGLVFVVLLVCLAYLFRQASDNNKTSDSSLHESSAFHMQLGHEIAEQLSSAHTELGNTQAILSDAIGKLVSNFILISDGVRELSEHTNDFSKQIREVVDKVSESRTVAERAISNLATGERRALPIESNQHVRTILEDLAVFNGAVAKNAIELNLISTNVEQNVLVVISTLQFQDMSSQLIEHARLRMTALQEVANEMGKGKTGSPTHKEYMEQIAAYNRLLDKHVVSLNKQKANPVAQKDFGTGDIELF